MPGICNVHIFWRNSCALQQKPTLLVELEYVYIWNTCGISDCIIPVKLLCWHHYMVGECATSGDVHWICVGVQPPLLALQGHPRVKHQTSPFSGHSLLPRLAWSSNRQSPMKPEIQSQRCDIALSTSDLAPIHPYHAKNSHFPKQNLCYCSVSWLMAPPMNDK